MSTGPATREWIAKSVNFARRVKIYNNAGASAAFYEGDAITHSSGTFAKVADSCTTGLFGICAEDIANAAYGWVYIDGVFTVAVDGSGAGINFAQGDPVYAASSSEVDTGTAGDIALGYVVNANPASGAATVDIRIKSSYKKSTTHA